MPQHFSKFDVLCVRLWVSFLLFPEKRAIRSADDVNKILSVKEFTILLKPFQEFQDAFRQWHLLS